MLFMYKLIREMSRPLNYTNRWELKRMFIILILILMSKNTIYHKDGTVWAKGKMVGGACDGYWEWFRKDGTKMRSGYFINGKQTGKWITYDTKGKIYKITNIKK